MIPSGLFSFGNRIGESRQILQNGVATDGASVGRAVVGDGVGSSVGRIVVGCIVGATVGFIVVIIMVGFGVGSAHSHGSSGVAANAWYKAQTSGDNCRDRPSWSAS